MKGSSFNLYLLLKKEYNFNRHGVNISHALAPQLMQIAYNIIDINKLPLIDIVRRFNKTLDVSLLKQAFLSADNVSTYVIERNDYKELLNSYFEGTNSLAQCALPSLGYKRKFNPSTIIKVLVAVLLGNRDGTFRQKIYLASYITFYLNVLDSLKAAFSDVDLRNKKYIPFNSAFDMEPLFAQFFKAHGAQTYHISHGLSYVSYYGDTPADAVNGENITADNILVWGESSKNDLVNNFNRNPVGIRITGNTKYPAKQISIKNTFKNGIVFLARPLYDNDNAGLIALLGEIGVRHNIKFTFKAHPSSNIEVFKKAAADYNLMFLPKETTIRQVLELGMYDFAVAYNTTVYYEAMYYDTICLRYGVNENEVYHGLNDKFTNEKTFINLLEHFKAADTEAINTQITTVLTETLGMGINEYARIFNSK
ncbi:MAG: hypothetical protein EOP47_12695 [Sphingobacteriaceae bacterium]|nr:MAG: hypothetical protein EOP47_12695 [Sphingobacteriaceae bacterium]